MINNDILRRVSTIFDFNTDKIRNVFQLSRCTISSEMMAQFFMEKDEASYQEVTDYQLASFLNGLIIEQRGKKDGPEHVTEQELSNNLIFNKIKIALALKAEEVIAVVELGGVSLSKYELSALFRNVNHKHYRVCSDEVLSAFLKGLKLKNQA